jgi:hypothetical protein
LGNHYQTSRQTGRGNRVCLSSAGETHAGHAAVRSTRAGSSASASSRQGNRSERLRPADWQRGIVLSRGGLRTTNTAVPGESERPHHVLDVWSSFMTSPEHGWRQPRPTPPPENSLGQSLFIFIPCSPCAREEKFPAPSTAASSEQRRRRPSGPGFPVCQGFKFGGRVRLPNWLPKPLHPATRVSIGS